MQIQGEITRITYTNEQNGYTVATIESNGQNITIVGKFFAVTVGQEVLLTGDYQSSKYGQQFAFTTYETLAPTSPKGIQKFLGSGLIKGVGLITAAHITKKFGTETLNIIEHTPERLADVKGISMKKALSIAESYKSHKHVQNVIVFLSEYGVSVGLAMKIFDVFKDKTLQRIQENPYCLIESVHGVGFLTADKIAISAGLEKSSPFRLRAGLIYTLETASEKSGHTILPEDTLFSDAARLLGLPLSSVEQNFTSILNTLALEKIVCFEKMNDQKVVCLEKYFRFESSLAKILVRLSRLQSPATQNIEKLIAHFEQLSHITFHPQQKTAIQTALGSGISVITGGPGTGKTTIIKCILNILEAENHQTLCLAPTGRAAKRMADSTGQSASTIHRALAMDPETNQFFHNQNNPLPCTAVIIDEFSMVDSSLAYYLFRALRPSTKVIIVGDKDQLPSVGAGNVLADILSSGIIPCANLTQIFRQAEGSLIITNAHLINNGQMPVFDNRSTDFFFEPRPSQEDCLSSCISLVSKRLPAFLHLKPQSIQVLAPMKNGPAGITNLNAALQQTLNPPTKNKPEIVFGNITFRTGDKIMQTQNNYNMEFVQHFPGSMAKEGKGVFNGDMGTVSSVSPHTGEVTIIFEGNKICTYSRTDLGQLSLSYAITIHKSQGSEFDAVVIPLSAGPGSIFNRNLIYTAITRAKKLVVLVGQKKHLSMMIQNRFTLKRHTLLKHLLQKAALQATTLFDSPTTQ